MCRILIFGGTTEGRLLGEFCEKKGIPAWLSVVSSYGRDMLGETRFLRVVQGAMEGGEMEEFFRHHAIGLVIDATHPYARRASENIRKACENTRVHLVRCLRREDMQAQEETGRVHRVPDMKGAVSFLETVGGTALVTTGSRELAAFTVLLDYRQRIYARVLPSASVMAQCEALGFTGRHLIGMQGPFTSEMNQALIRQLRVSWLVTKESGAAGGFQEKLDAACACGIGVVVIQRPEESGEPFEEVCRILEAERASLETRESLDEKVYLDDKAHQTDEPSQDSRPRLILAGIGPGSAGQMTAEVREAICGSDAILGAGRMLEAARAVLEQSRTGGRESKTRKPPVWIQSYKEDEILSYIKEHTEWKSVSVLYSGDTGFYSGAPKLAKLLKREGIPFLLLPGISSACYFAARLGTSWEDAAVYTAHGRRLDAAGMMEDGKAKHLVLMGGENGAGLFLRELAAAGYRTALAAVGENLSYPNERIRRGTVEQLAGETYDSLSLIMIEREPGE